MSTYLNHISNLCEISNTRLHIWTTSVIYHLCEIFNTCLHIWTTSVIYVRSLTHVCISLLVQNLKTKRNLMIQIVEHLVIFSASSLCGRKCYKFRNCWLFFWWSWEHCSNCCRPCPDLSCCSILNTPTSW